MAYISGPPVGPLVEGLPKPYPSLVPLEGRSVRLEPLSKAHAADLWEAAQGAEDSWTYLPYGPFESFDSLETFLGVFTSTENSFPWAVIPKSTGRASGWLTLMSVEPANGAIEVGNVWYSPRLQRTRASTEAAFLASSLAMDRLGYLRLVWKCNALNAPSRRAALRLGYVFEGVLRAHLVVKGRRRDTAFFSILADEWPARRDALDAWLSDDNFDRDGVAKARLCAPPPPAAAK